MGWFAKREELGARGAYVTAAHVTIASELVIGETMVTSCAEQELTWCYLET